MTITEYNDSYKRMVSFLEKPMPKEYDALIEYMDKLGILMLKAGEYLAEVGYMIDSVVDIETQTNIHLIDQFSASTFNMMIKAKGKDWNRLKTGFDRVNAAAVHRLDACRSVLSFEKSKMNLI